MTLKVHASRPVQEVALEWPVEGENGKTRHEHATPRGTLAADGKSGTITMVAERRAHIP